MPLLERGSPSRARFRGHERSDARRDHDRRAARNHRRRGSVLREHLLGEARRPSGRNLRRRPDATHQPENSGEVRDSAGVQDFAGCILRGVEDFAGVGAEFRTGGGIVRDSGQLEMANLPISHEFGKLADPSLALRTVRSPVSRRPSARAVYDDGSDPSRPGSPPAVIPACARRNPGQHPSPRWLRRDPAAARSVARRHRCPHD
jgi:hypothetical protein